MPGEPIDNRTLLRRTLITVGAMVGGSIVVVGTLTLIASSIAGHAVGAPDGEPSASASAASSAAPVHKSDPRAKR